MTRLLLPSWFCLVIVAILSCSIEDGSAETEVRPLQELSTGTDSLLVPDDMVTGPIFRLIKSPDGDIFFNDMPPSGIFRINTTENLIERISRRGRGPGEYQMPIFITPIDDHIAFTDPSSMDITQLDRNGNYVRTISHTHGGGMVFAYSEDRFYLQGVITGYLVHVLDQEGNTVHNMIPYKDGYQQRVRNFAGGGIINIDDRFYAMNSLEPVIYTFQKGDQEPEEVTPPQWEQYSYNFDQEYLKSNTQRELIEDGKLATILGLYRLVIANEPHLAVHVTAGERKLYVLDQNLELKFTYHPERAIVGIIDNQIFETVRDDVDGKIYISSF